MGMSVTMAAIAAEELGRAEISLALPVLYSSSRPPGVSISRSLRLAGLEIKGNLARATYRRQVFPGHRGDRAGRRLRYHGATLCADRRTAAGCSTARKCLSAASAKN